VLLLLATGRVPQHLDLDHVLTSRQSALSADHRLHELVRCVILVLLDELRIVASETEEFDEDHASAERILLSLECAESVAKLLNINAEDV
jgi:hypothetical protein